MSTNSASTLPRGPEIGRDLWIGPAKTGLFQILLACGR
ncbi:unnamed protein product [Penicillium roqueforti FM164]|uniref:Genomic scaffold, ProqFM164S03 n=1 Tax=Penicillium roqueforti (strain FM164) TaxID=1365484 RepID=W6QEE4_PENRF|nr:unnamed protein product [Penicillium roqueforti FM164]